jgi:hypothetical protein
MTAETTRETGTSATEAALPPPVADFGPVRLELMGHRYREGHLSEVVIAGQPFLRLDLKGCGGVEFYRPDAVYCITPGMTPPPRAEIPARFGWQAEPGLEGEGEGEDDWAGEPAP